MIIYKTKIQQEVYSKSWCFAHSMLSCLPSWDLCKCVEGQCRNFFLVYFACMNFFVHLIFPCMNFFFCGSPALARNPPPPPPPRPRGFARFVLSWWSIPHPQACRKSKSHPWSTSYKFYRCIFLKAILISVQRRSFHNFYKRFLEFIERRILLS